MNKGRIALKILKNKRARQIAIKALKNEKVRKVVAKQVSRRLLGIRPDQSRPGSSPRCP